MNSARAISSLDSPSITSRVTSRSRGVSAHARISRARSSERARSSVTAYPPTDPGPPAGSAATGSRVSGATLATTQQPSAACNRTRASHGAIPLAPARRRGWRWRR